LGWSILQKKYSADVHGTLTLGAHHWIFGEAFSRAFFFGSKLTEQVELWLLFCIKGLEVSALTEGLWRSWRLASRTALGVDFLPSFGDRGRVRGICKTWLICKTKKVMHLSPDLEPYLYLFSPLALWKGKTFSSTEEIQEGSDFPWLNFSSRPT
jgi:hypothetical protein